MKGKRLKITVITDIILCVVVAIVFSFGFIGEPVLAIYGGERITAIYNGNKTKNNISLMINVYENTDVVCDIINVLNSYGVKATFFVGGCWADDNQETLLKMIDGGHEIGNHGYFHKDHKTLSYEDNRNEIMLTQKIIYALTGVNSKLFAPPSGSYSNTTLMVASELNNSVIMWTKDTIDWRDSDEELIFKRATKNAQNGDLILMHPKKHTLSVLPSIINYYKILGYNLVTVSENIKE